MQELPASLRPGAEVRVRGLSWSIQSLEPGDTATAVDLVGLGPGCTGQRRTLLVPFDDITPVPPRRRPVVLREGPALCALRALLGAAVPWPAPGVAVPAAIELLPHQLSASIALRRDWARRVLIADPVGSGKTIQAGLAVADLLDRHRDARVLVVVPAGLRQQWADELRARFALDPRQIDGATWFKDEWQDSTDNPWGRPGVTLTSLDYAKRPEVLASLDALRWDLLVVDEAHHASPGTDRGGAIDAVCRRSLAVLLLTATPHDGDEARFRGLCALGRLHAGDRLLILRRPPNLLARALPRRTRVLRVAPSAAELRVRHLVAGYQDAMRQAATRHGGGLADAGNLLASVFAKRAASSPASLERSASRRLALMSGDRPAAAACQGALPFDGDEASWEVPAEDEGDALLANPGPIDWRKERAWLGALANAARRARHECRKAAALERILRRVREPVIVFTAYRDTLAWLLGELRGFGPGAFLHGLQSPSERQQQLDVFDHGGARWLLSTDVAAEGLNLQRRCRFVIEFDVPWTPLRSEQRIGRVDRIGQQRRVHAWTLQTHDEVDAGFDAAVRARRGRADDGLAAHPSLCDRVGHVELQCHQALVTARRLSLRALMVRSDAGRTAVPTLCGTSPRLVFASARVRRLLALPSDAALAVTEVLVTARHRHRIESIVVPLVVHFASHRPGSGNGGRAVAVDFAALTGRARAVAVQHSTHRVETLARELANALALDVEREALVEKSLRQFVAAHFAQPDLFGLSFRGQAVATGPGPRVPPVLNLAAEARVALIVLPRSWRNAGGAR